MRCGVRGRWRGCRRATAQHPLQLAIIHAAVGWFELCIEWDCYAVDVQPVAQRVYEVNVHYTNPETGQEAAGEGIVLRVRLDVEPGAGAALDRRVGQTIGG